MNEQDQPLFQGKKTRAGATSKALLSAMLLLTGTASIAQTTIFSEDMGTPSDITEIAAHDANNGFQNSGVYTYGGNADVRPTSPSSIYAGASGGGNVFLSTNGAIRFFTVSGINTTGYTGLSLSFGLRKTQSASDMANLLVEASSDGTNWTTLTFPLQATGMGTAGWRRITITGGTIPATSTLSLRWTNNDCCEQPRLDDILLTGTSAGGCGINLGPETTSCITSTNGVDSYTLSVPYTGSQPGLIVTNNSGSGAGNSGNDPAIQSNGTMEFVGITEGTPYAIGFSAPCASLALTGPSPNCGPLPDIVINEVLADPDAPAGDANGDGTSSTTQDEFVEIVNTGASAVDVSSWTLSDGFGLRHTFPVGSSIPAGCAFVVFSGGTPTGPFGLAVVQTASSGQLGLNNGGDDITLRDGSSTVIASYTYGAEGGNNASLTRDPDITGSFVLHSAATNAGGTLFSPGTRNDGSSFAGCQVDPCPLADDGIANFDENTCACELGYFATLETVGPDQVITACTVCPPGRYCPDGIAVLLCAAGAFQAVEGQTACLPCTAGTYNPVEGATSCLACDAGTYNGNVGATACQSCGSCAAGQEAAVPCSSTSDVVCAACPAETYNDGSQAQCQPCSVCPPGTFILVECSATTDRVCQACPVGSYCPDGIVAIECPAGRFQALEGQTECSTCLAGTFSAITGATECQLCVPGFYNPIDGATSCQPCEAGEFNDQFGAQSCQACPANTYNPDVAQTECLACPNGETSGVGAIECTPDESCTDYILELQNDANPGGVTWEVLDQTGMTTIDSGTDVFPTNSTGTQNICLADGCYQLRVMDNAGDGLLGYALRENGANGRRIIDNSSNMITGTSAISSGGTFCVPIGDVDLIHSNCDKLDWVQYKYLVCHADAAVAAEWIPNGANNVQDANSGYEFWIFDPNGSYSFRKFHAHNVSDGFSPANANRACRMKIHNWYNTALTPHIPENVLMNVRVRGRVNGVNQAFGPACTMMMDATRAACPLVKLQDDPANPSDYSCGVTRTFGGTNSGANKITALPPQFSPAPYGGGTGVRYQFRFRIPAENVCIVRPAQYSAVLYMNWSDGPLLQATKTYEVEVRVSKDLGATWCIDQPSPACDPSPVTSWGKACNVTISGVVNAQGGSSNMSYGNGALTMYPNPNNGEQLFVQLSEVAPDVRTVSVDLFDLMGKRVTARTVVVNDGFVKTNIDLHDELANGLYMVNITAGEKTYNERLVIQK